jgi:hypothetical protein
MCRSESQRCSPLCQVAAASGQHAVRFPVTTLLLIRLLLSNTLQMRAPVPDLVTCSALL